jgi:hypothetical protein
MTIGIIGRSDLFGGGQDVGNFGIYFSCCFNFQTVPNGPDPGDLGGGDEAEATLDTTWSAALAPGANVDLVVSATTNTTDGIDLSELFIVDNNLADIMTESFNSCELYATDAQLAFSYGLAEQAAAQGITYFVSSGDNGAEGCDDPSLPPATHHISVNLLASTPFNVAVGGTEFNENGNVSKYWGTEPPVQESAISYIPENVWNESSPTNGLWSSSGGASAGNIQGGQGGTKAGIPKPSWQAGVTGIPADSVRDLPDVSLTAAMHDPYLLCLEGSCDPSSANQFIYFVSGTSASAPSFAGIMALVDQQMGGRQGLANYVLYRLAATQADYPLKCNGSNTTAPPAAACIFNDVTVGNNVVPGEVGAQYQATAGYDQATGLGSVNIGNLITNWNTVTFNPTTTTLGPNPLGNFTHGQPVTVNIAVTPNTGTGTPSGDVSLLAVTGTGISGQSSAGFFTLDGTGKVASSTGQLPGGAYNVMAHYAGDATYAPSDSTPVSVTVSPENSTTTETLLAYDQNGNPLPLNNVPFGSFVYLRADVLGASGQGVPTGTVTFADSFGAIPGGSLFPLNSQGNTANPNGVAFDAGTHNITASYGGDFSFNASGPSSPQSVVVTPGFSASIPPGAQVLVSAPGMSGSTSVTVTVSSGFKGTIALSCTQLPSEAACMFSQPSITGTGTANQTSVGIQVTTQAPTVALRSRPHSYFLAQWISGAGLIFSMVLLGAPKQRRTRGLFVLLLLGLVVMLPGCSGGGRHGPPPNPGTPLGTYTVIVNAVSGSTTNSSSFTLVVQ